MSMTNWMKRRALPPLAAGAIRLFGNSMQLFTVGESTVDDLYRQGQRIIIAFWHGRQVMMPLAYRGDRASILISQHRDGELIARVMKSFGFGAIRGSSTRGGVPAIRQLIREGQKGGDLVVTRLPGTTRGVVCGQNHRVSHCALDVCLLKKKVFSSWDQFQVPYPGCRGLFVWGEPLIVSQQGTRDDLVKQGLVLEDQLNRMTEKADLAVMQDNPIHGYHQVTAVME